ncbi:MAG TPA: hypothetical protein VFV92_15915, partial [Candidatus Bathyarchaeia archaeon]|nr:hypothetical protein [Candidatus Bathyarchaeia archaeon]
GSPPCPVTDYSPPPSTPISFPIQVAVDHNGTVWFTDHGSNQFGSFNPSTNQWNTFPIGYCSEPYNPDCAIGLPNAISIDSNGLVWFSEHFAGRIAKYNQRTGVLTEYVVPANVTPYTWWMSPGPGNLVWFTAFGIGDIGYVNTTLPVPFGLSAHSTLQIARGTSENIQATIETANSTVSLNSSPSSYDAPLGGPPFLSGSLEKTQNSPTSTLSVATLSISAAWDVPLGERNIALTVYNSLVTVNVYVRVNVVENPAPYVTPGAAAAIGVGSIVLYRQNAGKRRKTVTVSESDSGSTQAQSR